MHHIKRTPVRLAIIGTVIVVGALGFWGLGASIKAMAIGGHIVLLVVIALFLLHRHRDGSRSGPPAT
jgi:hypothetical protein